MKKQILVLLATILSFQCYAQISFEKGYYINNTNQKTDCLIKNTDWKNNPTEFEYKLSENSKSQKATIASIKEFSVENAFKYVRSTVNIDRSSEKISDLSFERNPEFKEEELFLKVLVEGKSSLYQYVDGNLFRYFYNKDNAAIEQLIFKSFKTTENRVDENNTFKQQLWTNLNCPNFKMSKVERLSYSKSELVNFFAEYNSCNNQEYVNFEEKQKRDLLHLSVRPRINNSSLTIQNSSSRNTDFGNKIGFGVGVEAEFILPFNKNKWAIVVEPTYQSYKAQKETNVSNLSGGVLVANVDYNSIEVPISLRHYFYLNDNSKIFINASYVIDLSSKSSIEFTRKDGSHLNSLDVTTRGNLAAGIGYKQNDKYSIEVRYQTNREILGTYTYWSSEYKTLSVILGYSLF